METERRKNKGISATTEAVTHSLPEWRTLTNTAGARGKKAEFMEETQNMGVSTETNWQQLQFIPEM